MDKYGYIGIETLLNFCENSKDHAVTPNDFMRMNRARVPERKTGKWIFHERREPQYDIYGVKTWGVAYRCSECRFIHTVIEDFGHYLFCPNCGAKMEGEQ